MNTTTHKAPTLEAVKKALSKDWLERDGGSFVYQKLTGRLDWEKSLPSDSAYSEEFLELDRKGGRLSEEEIVRKAYGMARTLLDTLDIKGNVNLRLNPGSDDSYTDGRTVTASSVVLDDRSVDITHRLDILLGTVEHEGLHCEFTDFKVHSSDSILQSLVNIVEDERIEHCAGRKYPGLANFLKEFKYYYHNLYRTRNRAELDSAPYAERLVNAIISLVRYPKALTDKELEDFGEYLISIREAMDSVPADTAGSMVLANRIYDIIKNAVKQQPAPPRPSSGNGKEDEESDGQQGNGSGKTEQQNKGQNGRKSASGKDGDEEEEKEGENGSSGDGKKTEQQNGGQNGGEEEGSDPSESEDGKTSGNSPEKTGNSEKETSGEDGTDAGQEEGEEGGSGENREETQEGGGIGSDGSVSSSGDGEDGKETDEGDTPSFTEKEYRILSPEEEGRALDAIRKMLRRYETDTDSRGQKSNAVARCPEIDKLCTGDAERGEDARVLFLKQKESDGAGRQYDADRAAVLPFVPAMRNILTAQASRNVYALKGMKTGRLDAGKLSQAYIGSPNVYLQHKEVKSSKVAVCVLVDESDSMWGEKIVAARRTATLLNEALGNLPNVDLFVYGHTADDGGTDADVDIRVYRDHTVRAKSVIGGMEARSCNADGYAILEVARRVREQTQEKVLFFIISDGAPASRLYHGNGGITHTRDAVRKVTQQGFFPVQIAIDAYCAPSTMFDHYVSFTNMSELPRALSAMVKKAVLENTTRQ